VREGVGHALIGFRQWIPDEHIGDPVKSLSMGLPPDLRFRTKGQLAIDICTTVAAHGIRPDFYCGDEVYGNRTELREHFEADGQAYVLRIQKNFRITLPSGTVLSRTQSVTALLKHKRQWEIRSAGKGSKGNRWYARAWIATASPRHYLLIRKHPHTGELAFHYCFVPERQLLTTARLIRAAGLHRPVEEGFEFGKDCFGLDQSHTPRSPGTPCSSAQPSRSAPSPPHCCVTAPTVRLPNLYTRTSPRPPPQVRCPGNGGSSKRLIASTTTTPQPPEHATHWLNWHPTHQARSHWFHKRTRLTRNIKITQVS
jgi:hypothetical protein